MRKINECFECESTVNLQEHHVIPRSLGGKKTVTLCGKCHGKIHGLDFTDHGILIKKSLKKLKEKGVILGRPTGSTLTKKDLLSRHPDIHSCLLDNMSIRKTAAHTKKGASTVQRIKEILKNESK